MRPRSIRLFDGLFGAAFALTVISAILLWPVFVEQARVQAQAARLGDGAIAGIVAGGIGLSALIMLLLWYFVARARSTIAKWLTVLFAAYSAYATFAPLAGGAALGTATALSIVTTLLIVVATGFLFAADARTWFAGEPEPIA